jgi:NAD(P)-dependent dehydrogenase (short-subunit alcohol dehydrogenase family)
VAGAQPDGRGRVGPDVLDGIDGRAAFVSGAGQGIGRAIAERLAAEGARVAVNDIDAARASAVAEAIGGLAAPFDVSDSAAVAGGLAECERRLGPIDLLVANHAHMTMGPFLEQAETELFRHLEVNLLGTAWLIRACAPAMAGRGYGRIVAIASEWGQIGWPEATEYAASKGAIIALVKSVAREWASAGVAVNAVGPGVTDTPQLDVDAGAAGLTHEEMVAVYARDIPLGRVGRPEDVAATVAFLLSTPAIAFVGQVLGPNGGSTRI